MADAPGILACLRAAFEPYRDRYTPEAFADTVLSEESLRARFAAMTILVVVAPAGAIIGTIACAVTGGEGHLRGMAVAPDSQGSGLAAALLDAAEKELADGGCSHVTLDTTEPLVRAMRFYHSHGYRPSGRITDFFGMRLHEYVKNVHPG